MYACVYTHIPLQYFIHQREAARPGGYTTTFWQPFSLCARAPDTWILGHIPSARDTRLPPWASAYPVERGGNRNAL